MIAGEEGGMTAGEEMPARSSDHKRNLLVWPRPKLNVERPMTFVVEVEIMVNEDGSGGQIISMLAVDVMTNESAGDSVHSRKIAESVPIATSPLILVE